MTITLELTEDQERSVLESTESHDEAELRRVLMLALETTIEKLLREPAADRNEFEVLADRLATSFTASSGHGSLPEEALTREGLYGDHP